MYDIPSCGRQQKITERVDLCGFVFDDYETAKLIL